MSTSQIASPDISVTPAARKPNGQVSEDIEDSQELFSAQTVAHAEEVACLHEILLQQSTIAGLFVKLIKEDDIFAKLVKSKVTELQFLAIVNSVL